MGYGRVQREREVFQVVESHVLIDMLPARGRKRRQNLSTDILGIHHVTAIADDLQAELRPAWKSGTVPAEHEIRGVHTVTLSEDGYERTAKLLTETLGFRLLG